ncbi:hypothetical protein EVAR_62466_1 [Eumeta japonica]|uniref:Uncharacterized protein n=1 Tax=Eumeta variegata TaxID=151549 RepID=A0A4C1ZM39_EUMVA|nr:hypothetical protein EVAR_62466_1 [Eumeta japonica]
MLQVLSMHKEISVDPGVTLNCYGVLFGFVDPTAEAHPPTIFGTKFLIARYTQALGGWELHEKKCNRNENADRRIVAWGVRSGVAYDCCIAAMITSGPTAYRALRGGSE